MRYYKKFKPNLINNFIDNVKNEELTFINLYKNKNKFEFAFNETDIEESNVPITTENIGERLLGIYQRYKSDNQKADFECAKFLYENIDLTPNQASDANFWNYLHHFDMYKYIQERWTSQGNLSTHIKRHWLLNLTSQKHLISFPLTTLWWSVHLTINKKNIDNPYYYTEIYFSNNRFRTVSLGGMSFVRHKPAILSVLEFMKEHREKLTENITYTEFGDEISKFINLLGGTKPLSFFDKDWFTRKLEDRFKINSKLNIENKELEQLEEKNRLLKSNLLELEKKLSSQNSNQNYHKEIDYSEIEEIIQKGTFGAKESKHLIKKHKNSTNEQKQKIISLIETFLTKNNLLVEKRVNESFKLLKKTFLKQIIRSTS